MQTRLFLFGEIVQVVFKGLTETLPAVLHEPLATDRDQLGATDPFLRFILLEAPIGVRIIPAYEELGDRLSLRTKNPWLYLHHSLHSYHMKSLSEFEIARLLKLGEITCVHTSPKLGPGHDLVDWETVRTNVYGGTESTTQRLNVDDFSKASNVPEGSWTWYTPNLQTWREGNGGGGGVGGDRSDLCLLSLHLRPIDHHLVRTNEEIV